MRLRIIEEAGWRVVAEVSGDGNCDLQLHLAQLGQDKQLKSAAAGFIQLMRRIERNGPRASLPDSLYHCVDKEHEIYEFIKGPLRLLCFEADGALVVCSHIIRKSSNKLKESQKAAAIALRQRYLRAAAQGNVLIMPREQDGQE